MGHLRNQFRYKRLLPELFDPASERLMRKMIDDVPAVPEHKRIFQRIRHKALCMADGSFEIEPSGQPCRNRSRQDAAGSVRAFAWYAHCS